ncbi:hypothetical protein [Duganella sp. HH101]|uniref:hypothetical protein n=1 Tax=Duganella sp. HH101 TaxID=1781066 RepID=UPI000873D571|nr:hypothetical protein [Duganella sp. HH101]OFA04296.1 hypothetical protein DUGA2_25700 [Duganella sp. HH101]
MIRNIVLAWALAAAPASAAGETIDVAAGIQLAQIDFDTYHALLLERCKVVAPDAVDALTAVMAQWKENNADALLILRQLYKVQLIQQMRARQPDATDAAIAAHVAAVQGVFNGGLRDRVAGVTVDEAKASCESGYARTLQTQRDMDFNILLKRMTLGR